MGTMSKKCSRIAGILTMAGVMLLLTGCSQTQEEIYQIPEDKKIRDISKKERRHMIELMKNYTNRSLKNLKNVPVFLWN